MSCPLNHVGTVELDTGRLLLRQAWYDDAQKMYDRWTGDKKTTKYLSWHHESPHDTVAYLSTVVGKYSRPNHYLWLICIKREKKAPEPVGMIEIKNIDEDLKSCEISYVVGSKWWGRGIIPEALNAVLEVMFTRVGMKCVRACCDARDANNAWVMEQCGMTYDGCLRYERMTNTGVGDTRFYSVLKDEWLAFKAGQ